jgi:hypothetical protein
MARGVKIKKGVKQGSRVHSRSVSVIRQGRMETVHADLEHMRKNRHMFYYEVRLG